MIIFRCWVIGVFLESDCAFWCIRGSMGEFQGYLPQPHGYLQILPRVMVGFSIPGGLPDRGHVGHVL